MNPPEGDTTFLDVCKSSVLLVEAPCLNLRMNEPILACQKAPGILPLKKDAKAGVEPTTIATQLSQVLGKYKLFNSYTDHDSDSHAEIDNC